MSKIQHLLLTAAMLLVSLAASAQAKMTVELKNGTTLSFFVSEISKISWGDGTYTPGDDNKGEQTVTGDATEVTTNSAKVTCCANNILDNLSTDLKVGVIYTDNGTPTKSNGRQVTVVISSVGADGRYAVSLTDLSANTTYQYRSFVYQSGIYFYGEVKSFTTLPAVTFNAGNATNVTCFSAKVSAQMSVEPSATYSRLSYGICYGTTAEPTTMQQVTSIDGTGTYTTILRGLTGGTIYYYRPYADMDGTVFYGPVSSFKSAEDNVVATGTADAEGNVKSKLTIGGGAYSSLTLGLCWSTTNVAPTVSDNKLTSDEVDDDNSYTLTIPLTATATYYYRSYVLVDGVAHYGAVGSLQYTATSNHIAVDLGLSVKWATCNVGATKPEEYGDYFAWGETEPYYTEGHAQDSFCTNWRTGKIGYNWSSYKWCNGSSNGQTKYCKSSSYGTVDNKTILDPEDDAARVNWGGDWRMPTLEEQDELRTKCSWKWTASDGVTGYVVTGPNGNSIFLPAAGYRYDSSLYAGSDGYYWSSSLNGYLSNLARLVGFNSSDVGRDYDYRYYGQSVRPVCP